MGRPAVVSEEQVIGAGEALIASGQIVTQHGLWLACGMRGRPSRLYEIWLQHRPPEAPPQPADQSGDPLPEPVSAHIATVVLAMSETLEKTARTMLVLTEKVISQRYAAELASLQTAREDLRREQEEAEEALVKAADRIEELEEKLQVRDAQFERAKEVAVEHRTRLNLIELTLPLGEKRQTELELMLNELRTENGRLQERERAARAEAAQRETQLEALRKEFDAHREQRKTADQDNGRCEQGSAAKLQRTRTERPRQVMRGQKAGTDRIPPRRSRSAPSVPV